MSTAWKNKHKNPGEYYRYQLLRKQMLATNAADNQGRCTLAIPDVCTGTATQAHHTLGVEAGLLSPIIPVCGACNRYIGNPLDGKDPIGGPLPW